MHPSYDGFSATGINLINYSNFALFIDNLSDNSYSSLFKYS